MLLILDVLVLQRPAPAPSTVRDKSDASEINDGLFPAVRFNSWVLYQLPCMKPSSDVFNLVLHCVVGHTKLFRLISMSVFRRRRRLTVLQHLRARSLPAVYVPGRLNKVKLMR